MYFFVIILFLSFGVSSSAYSMDTLSWEGCLKETSISNPDLSLAHAEYDKALYEYQKSYSAFMPQVNVSASLRKTGNQVDTTTNTNSTNNSTVNTNANASQQNWNTTNDVRLNNQYTLGITANQNVFAGLKDVSGLKRLESLLKASQQEYLDRKLQVSFELSVAFSQTLYSQKLVELSKLIVERRLTNFKLVSLYYEGGKEHKGNFLFSSSALKQAEYELEQATRVLSINRAELSRVLGREEYKDFILLGELDKPKFPPKPNLVKIATNHPQVVADTSRVRAARASIDVADSQFYPELNLNANLSQRDDVWVPKKKSWYMGVSIDYPLFRGGIDYYNSKIARREHDRTFFQLQSRKNRLLATLEQNYQNFVAAVDNVKVLEEYLEASDTRAKIARVQYSNGLLRFENWDIIENDLIQRQRNLLSGKRDAKIAEATWNRNYGTNLLP